MNWCCVLFMKCPVYDMALCYVYERVMFMNAGYVYGLVMFMKIVHEHCL